MKKDNKKDSSKSKVKKESAVAPDPAASPEVKSSARAVARYLRVSPRKVRLVIDVVRRQPTVKAFDRLMSIPRKSARLIEKLLTSAVANAKDIGLDVTRLYISDIRADGGPSLKRYRPRSQGRADVNLKRMTHLSIELKEGRKVRSTEASPQVEEEQAVDGGRAAKKSIGKKVKNKAAKAASV